MNLTYTSRLIVLGTKDSTKMWKTSLLSFNHNGVDPSEAQRIKSEHPGEEECILQDRVLGSIAVTRGDLQELGKDYLHC